MKSKSLNSILSKLSTSGSSSSSRRAESSITRKRWSRMIESPFKKSAYAKAPVENPIGLILENTVFYCQRHDSLILEKEFVQSFLKCIADAANLLEKRIIF